MKFKLLCATFLLATSAFAQVQWGLCAGFNLSNLSDIDKYDWAISDEALVDYKLKLGFSLGVSAYVPINNTLGIETGLHFQQLGARLETSIYEEDSYYSDDDITEGKVKIKLNYLQVPILASYTLPVKVDWKLQAGPYLAVAVSGKVKGEMDETYTIYEYNSKKGEYENVTKTEHSEGEQKIFDDDVINRYISDEFGNGSKYESHRFDFGWLLGSSVTLNKFVFGVHYQFGMVSVAKITSNSKDFSDEWNLKNRCLHISFGVNF